MEITEFTDEELLTLCELRLRELVGMRYEDEESCYEMEEFGGSEWIAQRAFDHLPRVW